MCIIILAKRSKEPFRSVTQTTGFQPGAITQTYFVFLCAVSLSTKLPKLFKIVAFYIKQKFQLGKKKYKSSDLVMMFLSFLQGRSLSGMSNNCTFKQGSTQTGSL